MSGVQMRLTHWPDALHVWFAPQLPHETEQTGSGPHVRPEQLAVAGHVGITQVPSAHVPLVQGGFDAQHGWFAAPHAVHDPLEGLHTRPDEQFRTVVA